MWNRVSSLKRARIRSYFWEQHNTIRGEHTQRILWVIAEASVALPGSHSQSKEEVEPDQRLHLFVLRLQASPVSWAVVSIQRPTLCMMWVDMGQKLLLGFHFVHCEQSQAFLFDFQGEINEESSESNDRKVNKFCLILFKQVIKRLKHLFKKQLCWNILLIVLFSFYMRSGQTTVSSISTSPLDLCGKEICL